MYLIIGLICHSVTCTWIAPAFDSHSRYHTLAACERALPPLRGVNIMYTDLRCRRTDSPNPPAKPKRME